MKSNKTDVRNLVLQSYILDILKALKTPKRFSDLAKIIRNKGTLSKKLSKMKKQGLVQTIPKRIKDNYVNFYSLSRSGEALLGKLRKL